LSAVALARGFRRAAGRIALDEEDLGAGRAALGAVGELARQAQLPRGAGARHLLLVAAALALLGLLDRVVE
jgi:hypothetical protein